MADHGYYPVTYGDEIYFQSSTVAYDGAGDTYYPVVGDALALDENGTPKYPEFYRLRLEWEAAKQAENNLPWFDPGTPGNFVFAPSRQWETLTPAQQAYLLSIRTQGGMDFLGWIQERLGLAYDRGYTPAETVSFVAQGVLNGPATLAAAQAAYDASSSLSAALQTIAMLGFALYGVGSLFTAFMGSAAVAVDATGAALETLSVDAVDLSTFLDPVNLAGDVFQEAAMEALDAQASAQTAVELAQAATDAAQAAGYDVAVAAVDEIAAAEIALTAAEAASDAALAAATDLTILTAETTGAATVAASTGITMADAMAALRLVGGVVSAAVALVRSQSTGNAGALRPLYGNAAALQPLYPGTATPAPGLFDNTPGTAQTAAYWPLLAIAGAALVLR